MSSTTVWCHVLRRPLCVAIFVTVSLIPLEHNPHFANPLDSPPFPHPPTLPMAGGSAWVQSEPIRM